MLRKILFALLSAHLVNSQFTTEVPFVSGPVVCTSQTVKFGINPDNVGFATLVNYTSFVGVFVDNAAPICAEEPSIVLSSLFSSNYDLSISFSECNVTIEALYGAQHKLLQYRAIVYTRLSPVDFNGTVVTANPSYPNMSFPITCIWLTGAQVSNNQTVDNNDPPPPPPIGNTTNPVDQLNMTLSDRNGNPLTEVEAGTRVRVVLSLDRDRPFITVIADYCPYNDEIINSPFNIKAAQQDNNTYYFEFDAFTFSNAKSTLFITCYIQVCLDYADCYRPCWPIDPMSAKDLKEKFGHYRQIPIQLNGTTYLSTDSTIRNGQFEVVPKSAETSSTTTTTTTTTTPITTLTTTTTTPITTSATTTPTTTSTSTSSRDGASTTLRWCLFAALWIITHC